MFGGAGLRHFAVEASAIAKGSMNKFLDPNRYNSTNWYKKRCFTWLGKGSRPGWNQIILRMYAS